MDNGFVTMLKERADIIDIIGQYIELKRAGSNYKGNCPFHKENTPSFVVNEAKQYYKCFGCGKSGDVYTFIQDIENVEFYDAVKILAGKLGVEIPTDNKYDSKTNTLIKSIKEINLFSGRYYYKNLLKNPEALAYLRSRGVSSEMIKAFGLGYADNSSQLMEELTAQHSQEVLLQSGMVNQRDGRLNLVFRDRIMFPIFNNRNEIIAFGGRQMGNYGPKYINSPETKLYSKKENLYALNIARTNLKNQILFLVEGYMDVVSMHQNGYKNTVATLGTALTTEQAKIISKLASNVFILYDNDKAGNTASIKALNIFLDIGLDARVILLEDAKDPDDFFKKHSSDDFVQQIDNSKDYLMFNILQIYNRFDMSSNFEKDGFVRESVDFIKQYLKHPASRQVYVEESLHFISKESGYSIKSIGTDIFGQYFSMKQFGKKISEEQDIKPLELEVEEEIEKKEQLILNGLMLKRITADDIGIQDFVYSKNRLMYHQIKTGQDIQCEPDSSKDLSLEEYKMLIKSIKNTKIDMRIEYLEKVQNQILNSNNQSDMGSALLIAKYIINLKKSKY